MTAGKRQPPLYLEMDFAEALERFAGTNPKEVDEGMDRAKTGKPPEAQRPRRQVVKKVGLPARKR